MKKVVLTIIMVAVVYTANSQKNNGQTEKGKYLIELKTQIGGVGGSFTNTGFSYVNSNGKSAWSAGLDGGYFLADDFALKVGLGYLDSNQGGSSVFTYKLGAKYYLNSKIPFEIDVAGSNTDFFVDKPLFLGLSGGYAFFLGNMLSVEPSLKYSTPLNNKDFLNNEFQFNIGFSIHL